MLCEPEPVINNVATPEKVHNYILCSINVSKGENDNINQNQNQMICNVLNEASIDKKLQTISNSTR